MASRPGHRPDYFFLAIVFILTIFGLAMLASASSSAGEMQFHDSYYYLKHQIYFGLTLGLAGFAVGYFLNYQIWKKFAFPLLVVSIIFLAAVFTPLGATVRNTNRWLHIGPLSFQPAELMKLTYIIYLAAWLTNAKIKRASKFEEGLLPFLLFSGLVAALLIFEPATSTVVILLSAGLVIYFLSGAKIKYLLGIIALGALAFALVIYATPYRRARIVGFLHHEKDAQGTNYQVNQALIAIGSGGLTGVGYGQSATKASYLPTPFDDSIFAVIGEELGFVGAGGLIVLFAMLTFRLFWLANKVRDGFGKMLLVGFASVIAFQSLVNISAISGIIPLTGVPLPFISYGGTALAVFLTMSGIAANVSKYS